MIKNPKISVIIPCYNVSKYIRQCIESVLNQTYKNLEIIAVNDQSTDDTLQLLKEFSKLDNRIILINQINTGLSGARNSGIEVATGDFIFFLDGDDWLENKCIELLIEEQQNNDLVCCSYNRRFLYKNDARKLNLNGKFDVSFIQRRMVGLVDEELSDPSQADSLVTAWGKLYITSIIKKNNLKFIDTNKIGTEDMIFNVMYLNHCINHVYIIDKPLVNYRKYNQESLTQKYKPNLANQWSELFSLLLTQIKDKKLIYTQAYNNRVSLSIIGLGLNELNSNKSTFAKISTIKQTITTPAYITAVKTLNLKYFPIHWKIFFYFAKNKFTLGLFFMLKIIRYLISKNN